MCKWTALTPGKELHRNQRNIDQMNKWLQQRRQPQFRQRPSQIYPDSNDDKSNIKGSNNSNIDDGKNVNKDGSDSGGDDNGWIYW